MRGSSRIGVLAVAGVAFVGGFGACSGADDGGSPGTSGGRAPVSAPATTAMGASTTAAPFAVTARDLCDGAVHARGRHRVAADALIETSGLASSLTAEGVLWAHNDSGGEPELFAIGADGRDLGTYTLTGSQARDWEDMTRLSRDGPDVLFVADIGDNPPSSRPEVAVYRAPEPEVTGTAGGAIAGVERITLAYADGPRDAETLLADPITGDLFVVEKAWDGGPTGLYRIPADAAGDPSGGTVTMERIGDVHGPDGLLAGLVTAGDVSPDGALVALRTYDRVLLWDRAPDASIADALATTPCIAPSRPERQGEAIAFAPDGRGYVTISEGEHPLLHTFHL